MKNKLFLYLPFLICIYGFLPVNFHLNNEALKSPNTLLIQHQECGCPCPNAVVKEGQVVVPDTILRAYPNIETNQVNLKGIDPFDPYDPELAMQDIIVIGKITGVDTISCDPAGCEVVPVFNVTKWSVGSYYPRLWSHGKIFLTIFLFSTLLSVVNLIVLFGSLIKRKI